MMTVRYFLLLLLSILAWPTLSQSQQQLVDYKIDFKIFNAGLGVDGSIDSLEATIFFDPQQADKCVIEATADASTIKTGIRIRDKHLQRSDYFDVEKYPTIKLRLKELQTGKGSDFFQATFELSIKEVTKTIDVPLHYTTEGEGLTLSTEFIINRLDFAIGKKSPILSEEVEVKLRANLKN